MTKHPPLPLLAMVVAVSRNGVIGLDGELPWRMPDDLKWFKKITMGKPIIMGRTTYDGIGRPLPGRPNIVITRRAMSPQASLICTGTIPDAVQTAQGIAYASGVDEACIIGGASIYENTTALVKRAYITRIDADIEGDRKLNFNVDGWTLTRIASIKADHNNDYDAAIERWDRDEPAMAKSPKAPKSNNKSEQ